MVASRPRLPSDATMTLRWLLLGLLAIGLIVTAVDLLLLDHHEDVWQSIPLILIGAALAVIGWHVAARDTASLRALQALMLLFIVAGAAGVVLHYRGNMAFQLEMDPTQGGWTLFNKVIRAKAPPAMAPGAMAQLGLIGLIYGFRHPIRSSADRSPATNKGD
jgi:FtsH-binding integral membrane protein